MGRGLGRTMFGGGEVEGEGTSGGDVGRGRREGTMQPGERTGTPGKGGDTGRDTRSGDSRGKGDTDPKMGHQDGGDTNLLVGVGGMGTP